MKRKVVAGNWKMNTTLEEGVALVHDILSLPPLHPDVETIFIPPFTHLAKISEIVSQADRNGVKVGAQDCSSHEKGAYTGEVSAAMIKSTGASYVIVGHSERRAYHHEDDTILAKKIGMAFDSELSIIYCCGEPDRVREQGDEAAIRFVYEQLELLKEVHRSRLKSLILAYEPIWAIGTGKTATPEEAGAMCRAISDWTHENLGERLPVLYGGSCNAENARKLFAQEFINGGLIGGASLKAKDFVQILDSF